MSNLLFSNSQRQTVHMLRQEGVSEEQVPSTIHLARKTAEQWFHQEIEQGNLPLVIQLVKGNYAENSTPVLLEELKDLMVAKLKAQLGQNLTQAKKAASIVLPFVMKGLVDHLQQNPSFKTWWNNLSLRKHIPTKEKIKTKIKIVGQSISGSGSSVEISPVV